MLITQFNNFVNRSTVEILGGEIERENLVPMLSTDIPARLQKLKVTENGIYYPDVGYDGFSEVDVDIPTNLQDITITENGKYYPSEGHDGIYEVDVNVPKGSDGVLNFDFTKSFTDTLKNYTAITSHVNITDNGATFQGNDGYIKIPIYAPFLTYEIEVGEIKRNNSGHTRFLMYTDSSGFIYRSSGYWTFYRGNWDSVQISDFNFFNNSTIKLIIDTSYIWRIYKNDELVITSQGACNPEYNNYAFYIGSTSGQSIANGSTIKSLKVM